MSSTTQRPAAVPALLGMKCPSCRKGKVFVNKSIFPLSETTKLKEHCDICGTKLVSERNNGAGINYALTVIIFFLNLAWYCPLYLALKKNPAENWYDNDSVEWYLISSTVIVLLLQPWLMRISRMLYIYMYVGSGAAQDKF